jgi:hypothetical protein
MGHCVWYRVAHQVVDGGAGVMDKDGYNDLRAEYERGFIDGMQEQARRSVDRAVNAMVKPWVGLTDEEMKHIEETTTCLENESWLRNLTRNIEAKLKEKNL